MSWFCYAQDPSKRLKYDIFERVLEKNNNGASVTWVDDAYNFIVQKFVKINDGKKLYASYEKIALHKPIVIFFHGQEKEKRCKNSIYPTYDDKEDVMFYSAGLKSIYFYSSKYIRPINGNLFDTCLMDSGYMCTENLFTKKQTLIATTEHRPVSFILHKKGCEETKNADVIYKDTITWN